MNILSSNERKRYDEVLCIIDAQQTKLFVVVL
jgi:hypothetical protein